MNKKNLFIILAILIPLLFLPYISSARSNRDERPVEQVLLLKSLVILPFDNYTNDPFASQVLTGIVRKELKRKGWIRLTPEDVIEDFLAKRRIRHTGTITRLHARQMGKELDVDAILLGSVNLFSHNEGEETHIGLSLRIVNTIDGSIMWADSGSMTGGDFVTLFGLGRISDIKALTVQLVSNMTDIIASRFFLTDMGLAPFELEYVRIFPPIVKGGDQALLQLKFYPVLTSPDEVSILMGSKEVLLKKGEGLTYEETITVPHNEGIYPIEIIASDVDNNTYRFDAASNILVDNTPPAVELALNGKTFSPANRGVVTFTPELKGLDKIEEWSIDILDNMGKKIRSDKGFGKLPNMLIWRGNTDNNKKAEDGYYLYRFVVKDRAGNESTLTGEVRVKNVPTEVKLDIDVQEEKVILLLDSSLDEEFKSWKISFLNKEDGAVIKLFDGAGKIPQKIEYEIGEQFNLKKTSVVIDVVDEAGNKYTHTELIATSVAKKAAITGRGGVIIEGF